MHVVMIASENGALAGGKVGGIGDVIRDVPAVLARNGHKVTIINPGYQFLSRLPGSKLINTFSLEFASALEKVELYEVESETADTGVRMLLLDHPMFGSGGERAIYHHDHFEPFATDARNFALFCHAVCYALVTNAIPKADVLHLHDWHSAMLLILRKCHSAYKKLQSIPAVYTIHNLSLQGIRPMDNNWSSPGHWFPGLKLPKQLVEDPRYPDCLNLMRAGITLADRVHVVSPTYALEIQEPSHPELGVVRGEGLEKDLQDANAQNRLVGILNGCEYPDGRQQAVTHKQFVSSATEVLESWVDNKLWIKAALFVGLQRLISWDSRVRKPPMVLASVGRLTSQKMLLLAEPVDNDNTALDIMLQQLDNGIMIVLGSGDEVYEKFLLEKMRRHENLVFLNGFSEALADIIYGYCDLFLMPSSFEPCGISQMLAMRAGTPCLVHQVGGLADTVTHMVNGFGFQGADLQQQVAAMLECFAEVLQIQKRKLPLWNSICKNASQTRFGWEAVVREYEEKLYC